MKYTLELECVSSPRALEGAELVTFGEAEWLELRLEVDGLGWDLKRKQRRKKKKKKTRKKNKKRTVTNN